MSVSNTLGLSVTFRKSISESDVNLFSGITGDLSPNHVDKDFMKATPYGGRIARGGLLMGYMSGCSTDLVETCISMRAFQLVLQGYGKIRFIKGVLIGNTIRMNDKATAVDETKSRTVAEVAIHDRGGGSVRWPLIS